jgi:hypothetical protein
MCPDGCWLQVFGTNGDQFSGNIEIHIYLY